MTGHDGSTSVRVCLTRCPLPSAEERVHSLPCRIHYDGAAAVSTFFHPKNKHCDRTNDIDDGSGREAETRDSDRAEKNEEVDQVGRDPLLMSADFRGVQLQGRKVSLAPLGLTGLVLDDSGMRHEDDEGRIWEVDDHFDELTWWDVPHSTTSETQQLPLVLQQWHDLSAAVRSYLSTPFCADSIRYAEVHLMESQRTEFA
ncbi:unnamed protein product [Hyaloperonospora brassicae]|uniref:Uncharacterized protein n=1 Tax=Hyaloperonospora brassicae TaxID=162125 RepID=A0AAV0TS90_HYABA|nr:unnamed protein product [Hyaloperonospora brassicae]